MKEIKTSVCRFIESEKKRQWKTKAGNDSAEKKSWDTMWQYWIQNLFLNAQLLPLSHFIAQYYAYICTLHIHVIVLLPYNLYWICMNNSTAHHSLVYSTGALKQRVNSRGGCGCYCCSFCYWCILFFGGGGCCHTHAHAHTTTIHICILSFMYCVLYVK